MPCTHTVATAVWRAPMYQRVLRALYSTHSVHRSHPTLHFSTPPLPACPPDSSAGRNGTPPLARLPYGPLDGLPAEL